MLRADTSCFFVCSFVCFSLTIKRKEKNRGDDVPFHLAGGSMLIAESDIRLCYSLLRTNVT